MNANECQSIRFKSAYMAVRELNISKEAFAEAVGLSVSAVQQKISDCSLPSHSHASEDQALAAETLLSDLRAMKATGQPASEAGGDADAVKLSQPVVTKPKTKSTGAKRYLSQIEVQTEQFNAKDYIGLEIQRDGVVLAEILAEPTYNQGEKRWEALASVGGMLAIIEISFYQFG